MDKPSVLSELSGSDWATVFNDEEGYSTAPFVVTPDTVPPCLATPFKRADVYQVLEIQEGERDGDHWRVLVLLKDGRFAYLDGWCDYTGWDCQGGTSAMVADTLDDILRSMPQEARIAFGLPAVELKED